MALMPTFFDSMCKRITVVEKLVKCVSEKLEKQTKAGCPRKSQAEIDSRERKKRKITENVSLESRKSLNDAEMTNEVLVTENVASLGVAQAEASPTACKASEEMESGEQSLSRAHQALAAREKKVDEILRNLDEQISAVEDREKEFNCFVEKKTREIELKEEKLGLKLEDEKLREQQRLKYVGEIVERLRSAENKLEGMRENLGKRLEEIEYRESVAWESAALSVKEAELIRESLEKQLEEFERVRSEFNSFQEEKLRELESKEQLLNEINEKGVMDAKLLKKQSEELEKKRSEFNSFQEEKLRKLESKEQLLNEINEKGVMDAKLLNEKLKKQSEELEKKRSEFNSFQEEKLRKLESKEQLLNEINEKGVMDAKLLNEKLKKQSEELEKKRSEFNSFQEEKLRKLESKEQLLNEINEKGVMDAKLLNEKLKKQSEELEKKRSEFKSFQEEKLRKLESKERLLNEINEKAVKDAKVLNEKWKKQLEELEKKTSKFNSFEEKKKGELYAKEHVLDKMSEKISQDARLMNEKFIRHERSINQLLKRLMLDKDIVEKLKEEVDQRFKVLISKEKEINSTSDWVEKRMDEADSKAQKLVVKKERFKLMKNSVIRKKCELREKAKKLDSREQALQAWQVELKVKQKELDSAQELNKQLLEKLDAREKSMKELTGKCFKEHRAKKKELLVEKELVEKVARFLGLEEETFKDAIRELQHSADNSNGHHVRKELDESPDLKFTVRMDGKNLQMFLNDPEKDLLAMGDEIFKVFHLSSDPAKLVLDAMVGFYPPHLREGDTTLDVRKTCIALLKQLMKISREIKPRVREEAMQVAFAWKSKMRASPENPSSLETLGFLLLLAAYDLASSFNKDEISTLLMMVSRHREEAPDLYRLLGCAEMTLTENRPSQPPSNGHGLDKATQCLMTYQVAPHPLSSAFVSP